MPDGPDTLAAGTRLAHFEIRRLLGSGAMGSVYEAHDTALDRPVAIKIVHAELAAEDGVAERFTLEPRAAARVLSAAHAAGLVHRDVKPSNLLLTPEGRVKVTDFGLAKSVRGDSGSTQHGSLVGTPDYMSPEQCRGKDVDARTDVYLLGLT